MSAFVQEGEGDGKVVISLSGMQKLLRRVGPLLTSHNCVTSLPSSGKRGSKGEKRRMKVRLATPQCLPTWLVVKLLICVY